MATDAKKKIKDLLKEIEKMPGWEWRRRGAHITLFPPDKGPIVCVPDSPSDYRWAKNARSQLRRLGYTGTALD